MRYAEWTAWRLDTMTWGWLLWIAFFVVWETLALWRFPGQELTAHLRPVFLTAPVVWWLSFGLWLWVGVHLLFPALESAFFTMVRTKP